MRFGAIMYPLLGAVGGAVLFAPVGAVCGREALGICLGAICGAVVGFGVWAGTIHALTIGGLVGAVLFSLGACSPAPAMAVPGFAVGVAAAFVLRGVLRHLFASECWTSGRTWLWLGLFGLAWLSIFGTLPGWIPTYAAILLIALECQPARSGAGSNRGDYSVGGSTSNGSAER